MNVFSSVAERLISEFVEQLRVFGGELGARDLIVFARVPEKVNELQPRPGGKKRAAGAPMVATLRCVST